MARNLVLGEFRAAKWSGGRPARVRGWLALGSVLAAVFARPIDARASGIFRDLTAQDRSQPILLSATGEEIAVRSAGQAGSTFAAGELPAYLAFPLDGGEHLPAKTPTITTGTPSGGTGVGPLDLTSAVQGPLNADLLASHGAIVEAPGGSYAVAILPRYARALVQAASSGSSSSASGGDSATSVIASMFGLTPKANWTILGVSTNEVSQWIKAGSNELSHLTSQGAARVSKSLGVKVTPTSTGVQVAAQYLIPPSASSAGGSETVVTPEPGGWLVFATLLIAARLRRRAGRGPTGAGEMAHQLRPGLVV